MTPEIASQKAREICALAPIIPVIVVEEIAHARPLAEALVAGGLPALEVTLRSDVALDAIREMAKVPGGTVGAGTLRTSDDVKRARDAGAQFGVSPGCTDPLIQACEDEELPLLGGVSTASEAMRMLERGYTAMKFFPAEAAGGVAAIKAIGGPLPQIGFCPTGGISPQNARTYIELPNVLCAGGSWVAPQALMRAGRWDEIESLAREASRLGR